MFSSNSPRVANHQLKVQELCIHKDQDSNLFQVDGADVIIFVDEAVNTVKSCMVLDNSVPGMVAIPAASLSVVDSSAFTAGGDRKAIKIATLTLATNDVITIKYDLR
jgi:hypothetical protein